MKIYGCQEISDLPSRWGQVIQYPTDNPTFHSEIFSYRDTVDNLAYHAFSCDREGIVLGDLSQGNCSNGSPGFKP